MAATGAVGRSTAESAQEPVSEATKVFAWRFECLLNAGYDFEAAWLLANSSVDLHTAVEVMSEGCDIRTALLILL